MKALYSIIVATTIAMAIPQLSKGDSPSAIQASQSKSSFVVPDRFKIGLGKAFAGYLNIQEALAHDEFQKGKISSDSMLGSLKGIRTSGLNSAAKSHWDSSSNLLTKTLQPMASSQDISTLRSHFIDLTPLVVGAIENFGIKPATPVYLFHCPMVNANWLQKDKANANPFYGQSMSECGSLVREVKTP